MTRRIVQRRSPIHGNGVFAACDLQAGITLIEYRGKRLTHAQANRVYGGDADSGHTFLFTLNDKYLIDANEGGNAARWINHSCAPNCEPIEHDGLRVFIHARRTILAGEELTYDYRLVFHGRLSKRARDGMACRCGARRCRGTMLDIRTARTRR